MKANLKVGISSADNRQLFMEIYDRYFNGSRADTCKIDNKAVDFEEKGLSAMLENYDREIFLSWENKGYLTAKRNEIVLFGRNEVSISPAEILAVLEELSFEVASFGALYDEWLNPFDPYEAPSFSNFHLPHGWACAFKEKGFDRLVSRKWLDFGPWKQHVGKNDTQLVQFHQLGVDAETAKRQAEPGHRLMGITDEGGFIQKEYVYQFNNEGLYDAADRKLKVVVHGKDIPLRQMLDACAARLYQALGPEKPLDNVAYVFMDEKKARGHLHPLWLRNLECRAIVKGKDTLLNEGYHPVPEKPAWTLQT